MTTKQEAKELKEVIFFVYGTLKKGYGNHVYLKDAEFLGEFETPKSYTLYDGGFPIVNRGGETSIKGELYKTSDPKAIRNTFGLEGCYSMTKGHPNNWYDIDYLDTPFGQAVIFVQNPGQHQRTAVIESGRWGR